MVQHAWHRHVSQSTENQICTASFSFLIQCVLQSKLILISVDEELSFVLLKSSRAISMLKTFTSAYFILFYRWSSRMRGSWA